MAELSYDPCELIVPDLLRSLGIEARHDGDSWWASCPFGTHQDSDPSWKINDCPGSQKHAQQYCFGCTRGGGAVHLVADVLNLTLPGAVDWILAKATGKAVATLDLAAGGPHRLASSSSCHAAGRPGCPARAGDSARDYAREWGITAEQADCFPLLRRRFPASLGGASWMLLPRRPRFAAELLALALRFWGTPRATATRAGRRATTPAGPLSAPPLPPAAKRFSVLVAEGAVNALALERCVPPAHRPTTGVAALNGSAVNLRQAQAIASWQRVVVVTDPDFAGDRAAEKIASALARHDDVVRVRLPRGEDPASLASEDLRSWIEPSLTQRTSAAG